MSIRKVSAALVLAAIVLASSTGVAAERDKYIFQVPMVKGLWSSMSETFDSYIEAMSQKLGFVVEYQKFEFLKGTKPAGDILQMVKDDKVHFTYLYASEYMEMKDEVDKVMTPFMSVTMLKRDQTGVCAYVKTDSPYEKISDLRGKRWGGSETMRTRFLMHQQGIDEPMADFFGEVNYIDDGDIRVALDAVINGDVDVYTAYELLASMLRSNNKTYVEEIRQLSCGDFEHNWIFFYKNDVPREVVGKVRQKMLKAHKDKELFQFRMLLAAIKGNFIKYNPDDMESTERTVALMKEHKWLEEEQAFVKKHLK